MEDFGRKLFERVARQTSVIETGEFGRRERKVLPDVYACTMELINVAKIVQKRFVPDVAIVLGSGLGGFEEKVEDAVRVPFSRVGLKTPKTEGHKGEVVLGRIGARNVVVLAGRVHYYEGHDMESVVQGVRMTSILGAKSLLLSNAAGAVNPDFSVGDLMVLNDHINMMGTNPLRGENSDALGPRFPDMSEPYHPEIRRFFHKAAQEVGVTLKEGVYMAVCGPSYETKAEIRAFGTLGADAVGMSTVPEVIAGRHAGMWVGAISVITNMAAGLSMRKLDHEEVKEVGARASKYLHAIFEKVIGWLPKGGVE
jgi:purine-nucleoside phosphorylase